jgi:hypothetical protein
MAWRKFRGHIINILFLPLKEHHHYKIPLLDIFVVHSNPVCIHDTYFLKTFFHIIIPSKQIQVSKLCFGENNALVSYILIYLKSRDSSGGIALGYGLIDYDSRVRFPAGAGNFCLYHRVQNGSGAHPASYPMGTRGSFSGGRASGAWSWPFTFIWCRGKTMRGAYLHSSRRLHGAVLS